MSAQRGDYDQRIRAFEDQADAHLASLRLLAEQWGECRQKMHESAARFEQACIGIGAESHLVQKRLAARRELDAYAERLFHEQEELSAEAAREIRVGSEDELERLRQERDGASWD